jgi:hypothetical protein
MALRPPVESDLARVAHAVEQAIGGFPAPPVAVAVGGGS